MLRCLDYSDLYPKVSLRPFQWAVAAAVVLQGATAPPICHLETCGTLCLFRLTFHSPSWLVTCGNCGCLPTEREAKANDPAPFTSAAATPDLTPPAPPSLGGVNYYLSALLAHRHP